VIIIGIYEKAQKEVETLYAILDKQKLMNKREKYEKR